MRPLLQENLTFDQAQLVTESANDGKDLYMKGICIQGGVKNANQRVYCLLYTSPSPRDAHESRMPSSA